MIFCWDWDSKIDFSYKLELYCWGWLVISNQYSKNESRLIVMTDCFCSLAPNWLFSHFTCFLIISLLLQQLQDTLGHFFNRLHVLMTRIDHPDQFGWKLLINQSFLELQEPDLCTCCASCSLQSLLHPFPACTGPSAAARGAFWSFFGHFLLSELELQRVSVPPTEPEV